MKIVNRRTFLSLPTPFMFIKCDKFGNTFGDLSMNVGICGSDDFVYNSLVLDPDFEDSGIRRDKINNMLEDQTIDLPVIDFNTSRDGFHDEDQLFVVFSKDDFDIFTRLIQKYQVVYGTNNDIEYESD